MELQTNLINNTGRHAAVVKLGSFAEPEYFSPAEYFLGVVERVIASGENSRISMANHGAVTVLPHSRKYHANVEDMQAFCEASASSFKVTTLKGDGAMTEEDGMARNLDDLLWQAAFHASRGRLVQSRSNGESVHIYDVIRFHHWPNLSRLPQTPNTMRICALLTRQPSSILLVSRKLGIEPEEVYQVYSAACGCGIVKIISSHLGESDIQATISDADIEESAPREKGLFHSLFAKIVGL